MQTVSTETLKHQDMWKFRQTGRERRGEEIGQDCTILQTTKRETKDQSTRTLVNALSTASVLNISKVHNCWSLKALLKSETNYGLKLLNMNKDLSCFLHHLLLLLNFSYFKIFIKGYKSGLLSPDKVKSVKTKILY